MLRLHEIERQTAAHEVGLERARRSTAEEWGDDDRGFGRRWHSIVSRWSFDETNDLIERHNRWYPTESRLPMDPSTGDFALVNGRDYRISPLDAEWALARFPADLAQVYDGVS
jgi:hypothetical protein